MDAPAASCAFASASTACAASPLAWIVADMFLIPGFMYCIRRLERVFADREPKEGFQYE